MADTLSAVAKAVALLVPGADFADIDGTLAGIRWDDLKGQPRPTQAQVDAAIASLAVPVFVTNAQLKRQLDALGKLTASHGAVTQAGGLVLELWYGAGVFHRADPLLNQMAAAIGMAPADIDAAFIAAEEL